MSKKTLVYVSNNIISSRSLIEKLDSADIENKLTLDNLQIGQLSRRYQDRAMANYLKDVVNFKPKVKFSRQTIIKPLEPGVITSIYPNFDFFSDVDKQLLLLRASLNRTEPLSSKTLTQTINSMINPEEIQLDENQVYTLMIKKYNYSEDFIRSFLNGNIFESTYTKPKVLDKPDGQISKKKLDQQSYQKTHTFFSRIVNIISEIMDINLLFIIPSVASEDVQTSKSLIVSDIIENRTTMGLVLSIPGFHEISFYKKANIPLSTIFYDNILQLDYKNNNISGYIGDDITKKIIMEIGLNSSNNLFVNHISDKDEITFEPLDRKQPLKIVELKGPDDKNHTYLLGIYGNLYEDDDNYNDLVGRLESWEISNDGKSKVFWCNNYYQKLSS